MTRARPPSPIRREQGVRFVGGVDQRLLAGEVALEQIGVVGHPADGDLGDLQVTRLLDICWTADLDLTCVRHAREHTSTPTA